MNNKPDSENILKDVIILQNHMKAVERRFYNGVMKSRMP